CSNDGPGRAAQLVATPKHSFEEGGPKQEEDHADAEQPDTGTDVARPALHEPIHDHANAHRSGKNQGPGIGPATEVAGGVLNQKNESRHRRDAAEDGQSLAGKATRGQGAQEQHDSQNDDDERPAVLTDVDMNDLSNKEDRANHDQDAADQGGLTRTTRIRPARAGPWQHRSAWWCALVHEATLPASLLVSRPFSARGGPST